METLIPVLLTYKYLLLFPLSLLEGPILSVVVGFLISQQQLNFFAAYAILMAADILRDTALFLIGRWLHPESVLSRIADRFKHMDHLWTRHTVKTLMISKWAYGLSFPMLISAGLTKLSVKKFVMIAFLVTMFQYAVLIALGFYFGKSYQLLSTYIVGAQLFLALGIVIIVVLYVVFSKLSARMLPPK
jgi:membrane-associated protein